MWYWNQKNFEGLVAVADSVSEPAWELFAEYCRLRERGLRSQSLDCIAELIISAESWLEKDRRWFADWLCDTQLRNPGIHQLIPTPLKTRFIVPVLQRWAADSPRESLPQRWLGCMTGDYKHFSSAIAIDPTDDVSRYRLVGRDLADVDYQLHHLPDVFIGDVGEAIATLDRANSMCEGFVDPRIAPALADDFNELYSKIRDWQAF